MIYYPNLGRCRLENSVVYHLNLRCDLICVNMDCSVVEPGITVESDLSVIRPNGNAGRSRPRDPWSAAAATRKLTQNLPR